MGRKSNVGDDAGGHPGGEMAREEVRHPGSDPSLGAHVPPAAGGQATSSSGDSYPVQDRNGVHPAQELGGDDTFGTVLRAEEPYGLPSDPAREAFPKLWPWLTRLKLPSGKLRQVSRIGVAAVRTGFAVTLQDITLGYKLSVRAETLPDVFQALEDELSKAMPGWMPIDYGEGAVERKRKAREDMDKRAGNR